MRNSQRTQEEEFDSCFDANGMLKDGITRVVVPHRLIDAMPAAPKRPDYYVRVDSSVALDGGEYTGRRPKKKQYRDPQGREAGTSEEVEDSVGQAGFVARDAATHARLDDLYNAYDAEIAEAWKTKPITARDDAKTCQDCGTSNRADASFCDNCGAEFADDGVDAIAAETQTHNYDSTAEPLTGIGSHGTRGQQEGAVCTINGRAGHLRNVNGTLECVPDARTAKTAPSARREYYDPAVGAIRPHGDSKDAAYSSYDSELRDAWRRAT
jgi:hypothetical protein